MELKEWRDPFETQREQGKSDVESDLLSKKGSISWRSAGALEGYEIQRYHADIAPVLGMLGGGPKECFDFVRYWGASGAKYGRRLLGYYCQTAPIDDVVVRWLLNAMSTK